MNAVVSSQRWDLVEKPDRGRNCVRAYVMGPGGDSLGCGGSGQPTEALERGLGRGNAGGQGADTQQGAA
jgi:hypothetical protein